MALYSVRRTFVLSYLDLSEDIFDMCIVGPNENITQEYPGLVAKMGYVPEYPKVFELV